MTLYLCALIARRHSRFAAEAKQIAQIAARADLVRRKPSIYSSRAAAREPGTHRRGCNLPT
jgi:hypothetical protein